MDVLDSKRVPLNRDERALRLGEVPYFGATGQVGWIDEPIFDEELVLLGEDGAPFLDPAKPKAYLIAGPSWVNNHAHVLRANPEVTSNGFLLHYLNGCSYEGHVTGTTRLKLNQAAMRAMPYSLPPLAEQERIVRTIEDYVSHLDAAEASLAAARKRCAAATRSVILNAIPRRLPATWETATVADAGRTSLGRQRSPRFHHGSNMKPYLRVANVFEDRIDSGDVMEMHFEPAEFDRYRLQVGDVLLNEGQSPQFLGRPAIYRGEPPEAAFTNSLIRFVPGEKTTPEWALLVFRHHMHSRRFMQESNITTNIAHLALGRFRTVEFPLPPLQTQQEIVDRVRISLDAIAQRKSEIERVQAHGKALRRSVLAAAFSGRLVAQDSSDEPAELLLARIAVERSSAGTKRRTTTKVEVSSS